MKRNTITLIFVLFTLKIFSQPSIQWQKLICYAGEGYSVQQTTDGGYIVGGYSQLMGMVKLDSSGNIEWDKRYKPSFWYTDGYAAIQTSDGNYVVAGSIMDNSGMSNWIYLVKTDSIGNIIWSKKGIGTNGGESASSLIQDSDGNLVIIGSKYNFSANNNDIYIVKSSSFGNVVWTKTYGGTNNEDPYSIVQTYDSSYVITGITSSFGSGNRDVFLIKISLSGNLIWAKTYGGINDDLGYSVKQTADSGFIVTGYTASFGAGDIDVYLIKTDSMGDTLWTRTYGGLHEEIAYSVQQTNDEGYILTGAYDWGSATGSADVYMIKTNSTGDTLWTRAFGGIGLDQAFDVQQTHDGGYILSCEVYHSFGTLGGCLYLIKTDSLGNSGCNENSTLTSMGYTNSGVTTPPFISGGGGNLGNISPIITSAAILTPLCTTVNLNEPDIPQYSYNISPNPFTSSVSISIQKNNVKKVVFTIKNVLGQTIFNKQDNNLNNIFTKTIDLSFLSNGIYLLDVNIDGRRIVKKIVKE